MKIAAIIPVKMGAKRFPGKPLELIRGVPMVGHIYARAKLSKLKNVYVAAHDEVIAEYIRSKGGQVLMEKNTQKNALAGAAYVLPEIEKKIGSVEWIILIQGDEPMITPETIDQLISAIKKQPKSVAINVVDHIRDEKEYYDPNIVKIVLNKNNEGMWFFRIPSKHWENSLRDLPIKKQTGVIALKKDFLVAFGSGERLPVEKVESVDMFRLIESGGTIPTVISSTSLYSVDTEEDKIFVENLMKSDPIIDQYVEQYKS